MDCCSLLQGTLRDPGLKPRSPALQADSLPSKPPGKLNIGPRWLFTLHINLRSLFFLTFMPLHMGGGGGGRGRGDPSCQTPIISDFFS